MSKTKAFLRAKLSKDKQHHVDAPVTSKLLAALDVASSATTSSSSNSIESSLGNRLHRFVSLHSKVGLSNKNLIGRKLLRSRTRLLRAPVPRVPRHTRHHGLKRTLSESDVPRRRRTTAHPTVDYSKDVVQFRLQTRRIPMTRKAISEPAGVCRAEFSLASPDMMSAALQEALRDAGITRSVLDRIFGPNRVERDSWAVSVSRPLRRFGRMLSRWLTLRNSRNSLAHGDGLDAYIEPLGPSLTLKLNVPCPRESTREQFARRWTTALWLLGEAAALLYAFTKYRRTDFSADTDNNILMTTWIIIVTTICAIFILLALRTQVKWAYGQRTKAVLFPGKILLV